MQETADGQVVVFHDSDFKKSAGIDLKIWDATMDDLARIDVGRRFGPAFAGERVPTLRQVLEACRNNVRVIIELKDYGHGTRLAQRTIGIVESLGMQDHIAIMSLKRKLVQQVHDLRPKWRVGLLLSVAAGNPARLEVDFLAANAGLATPTWIHRMQSSGKRVFVWTVNDPSSMSRMAGRKVDGLITDHPALAREVLRQHAQLGLAGRIVFELAYLLGAEPRFDPI